MLLGLYALGKEMRHVRSDYRAERGRGGTSAEDPEEAAHNHGLLRWYHQGRAVRRWMASAGTRPRSCVVRRYSSYSAARTCASRTPRPPLEASSGNSKGAAFVGFRCS